MKLQQMQLAKIAATRRCIDYVYFEWIFFSINKTKWLIFWGEKFSFMVKCKFRFMEVTLFKYILALHANILISLFFLHYMWITWITCPFFKDKSWPADKIIAGFNSGLVPQYTEACIGQQLHRQTQEAGLLEATSAALRDWPHIV